MYLMLACNGEAGVGDGREQEVGGGGQRGRALAHQQRAVCLRNCHQARAACRVHRQRRPSQAVHICYAPCTRHALI